MKAFALPDFDHEPALTDLELPEPSQGEVRVRVRAASVNGFDLAVANGFLKGAMEHHFPVVLGKDFAGEVDALGADVEGYSIGDRVFGVVTKPSLGDGSLGEYVTVSTAVGLAHLPEGIDFIEGASLGLAGTAAVDAFDAAHLTSGSTVLIAGATGGVGQQALQLAVRAGATVAATASSPEEIDLVTRLGAAQTIDYRGTSLRRPLRCTPRAWTQCCTLPESPPRWRPQSRPAATSSPPWSRARRPWRPTT